jgi:hypothetical protein
MKRLLLLLIGLALLIAGCGGGERDKGIHNNRDRPRPADKGER